MLPDFIQGLVAALGWEVCVLAPLTILFGYVIFGMVGFGATLTNVPLLAHLLPLRFVVPLTLLLDLAAALAVGAKMQGAADRAELRRILPFVFLGMAAGLALLVNLPERVLLLLLGSFALYAGFGGLFRRDAPRLVNPAWAAPAGIVGGVFSALYGIGGPIYTIYLSRRILEKSVFRATMARLILTIGIARVVMFGATGLLTQNDLLLAALLLAPFMALGLLLGNRLHNRMSAGRIMRFIHFLILANGIALILRAL